MCKIGEDLQTTHRDLLYKLADARAKAGPEISWNKSQRQEIAAIERAVERVAQEALDHRAGCLGCRG